MKAGLRLPVLAGSRLAIGRFVLGAVLAVAVSACTNNFTNQTGSNSLLTTGGSGSGGILDVGTSGNALTITNVIKDNSNPTTVLDIIGDGSNAMANLCLPGSGVGGSGSTGSGSSSSSSSPSTSSNSGPSTCACTYAYTSPSLGAQQVDVDTVYHESNLIECPYTTLPADVTAVTVSVHVLTQNAYSNTIDYNLTAAGIGASPTDPSNFVLAQRFQCRDIVSITYPFGPSLGTTNAVYDPIQSEDPSINYPLDFYTTNMGGSYQQYISNNVTNWDCPANPNDPNFGTNYTLYSVGPDSGGSKEIYPPAGSAFDRSTFYVSKTQAGVFTVPVDAYIAPTITGSSVNQLLGYGAAPVPAGPSQETCPDTVAIPTGFHWVKVWLFRADLPDRRFFVSPAIAQTGQILCNPGGYPGAVVGTDKDIFQDCGTVGSDNPVLATNTSSLPNGPVADRVIAGEGIPGSQEYFCAQMSNYNPYLSPTPIGPGSASQSYTAPGFDFAAGTDLWKPRGGIFTFPPPSGFVDPLGISSNYAEFVPKDMNLSTQDIDQGKPRYDFVYVVTPPTVMAADMENSSNSADYPYIPYRFANASDCTSADPDAPAFPGDCDPSKIIHYGLKLHDVSSNGDPPANDPNRPGDFPVCALQPN